MYALQAQTEAGLEKFLLEKDYHAIVDSLRGFGRAAAASRTGYPASHGKWIRIRRRGRLEDGRHGQADEDYDPGYEGRQGTLFHGRL